MIEIGGEKRPIVGNINALIELKKDHGIDVINGFNSVGFEEIRALIFVALKYGAKKEKQEFKLTLDDVGEWLTPKSMQPILKEVLAVFMDGVEIKSGEGKPGEQLGANSGE